MSMRILALSSLIVAIFALMGCGPGGEFGQPPPSPERAPQVHPGQ
jgi:hypothetical protein